MSISSCRTFAMTSASSHCLACNAARRSVRSRASTAALPRPPPDMPPTKAAANVFQSIEAEDSTNVVRERGCRPVPHGVWAVAPAVSTPHCLRGTRQDLPCTSPAEPRTPAESPVRAPRWSSAEVFSWHQRGGREGENGLGTVVPVRTASRQGEVKGSPVRSRGPGRLHWLTQRGSDRRAPGRRAHAACPPRAQAR